MKKRRRRRRRRRRRYHLSFMGMLCIGKLPKKSILVMDFHPREKLLKTLN
jgi:hypothetical protein